MDGGCKGEWKPLCQTTDPQPTKEEIRQLAYNNLKRVKAARFPFPIEDRIPNFKGAEAAARRLAQLPVYRSAKALKVNPDAPQLPVRAMALRDGKVIYMPTPRLRGAFMCIHPEAVPPGQERRAASLSHCSDYGQAVPLEALALDHTLRTSAAPLLAFPPIELVVTGSVAVTRDGRRAGKGEGYADLEYAILRELGYGPVPVATTVHPAQIVPSMSIDPHDLTVDYIVTPDEIIETHTPYRKPAGIDWDLLSEEDLLEMPVLRHLRHIKWESMTVRDVLACDLDVVFVGLNPGRASAAAGHHFAGPNNHFWRLLYDAGFTHQLLAAEDDGILPNYGLGITNIVDRATRGEGDLSWPELLAGGAVLREKIAHRRPRIVALLGKQVYRAYAGLPRNARVDWGLQSRQTVPGVMEFLAPNPSSRSTIPYEERLALFRQLYLLAATR